MLLHSLLKMSMLTKLGLALALVIMSGTGAAAAPTVAQSLTVDFPVNGRVIVQAREEVGKFPQMLFISERTHKILLVSSIQDRDKFLIPAEGDGPELRPSLRFRVIQSPGFRTPIIMSVGVFTGGSDNAYFLTLFGEAGGKILRLNAKPI